VGEIGATDFVLGCVLSQYEGRQLHLVTCYSRILDSAVRNYEIQNKELVAIREEYREWRRYLTGKEEPVTLYTDHQNLQSLLTKEICNMCQI